MIYPPNIEEIEKFAEKMNLDVRYLLGKKWKGDLWLGFAKTIPKNIIFNVDGWLYIGLNEILPANIQFNVKGNLHLASDKKVKIDWS